jgi:hypothetical protein
MAKKAKKGNGKAKAAVKPDLPKQQEPKPKAKPKGEAPDLGALRKPVLDANAGLTKAETEAKALVEKGLELITQAKGAYLEAVGAYREACRKAGVDCEFPGGRSENVSPKVSFIVECQRRFSCGQIYRFIFGHFCRFDSFLWWHGVSPFFASWVQSDRPGGDGGADRTRHGC